MNLWVDDLRPPPSKDWIWAQTFDDARILVRTIVWDTMSLDHDLADIHYAALDSPVERTGFDLVRYIRKVVDSYPHRLPNHILVHSMNPVGKAKMEAEIADLYQNKGRHP